MFSYEWRLLGISPTKDEDAIRRAYAEALKKHHPEDDPERWAELHSAYSRALAYARQGKNGRTKVKSVFDEVNYIGRAAEDFPMLPDEESGGQEEPPPAPPVPFAEDFEAALAQFEAEAAEKKKMRSWFPRVRRAKDVEPFLQALQRLPLGMAENPSQRMLFLLRRAMSSLRTERMTRDALEAVIEGLWELTESLPHCTAKNIIAHHARELGGQLRTIDPWENDRKDLRQFGIAGALIAIPYSLVFAWLAIPQMYPFAAVVTAVAVFLFASFSRRGGRLRSENRAERTPSERKCARLLALVLAVWLVSLGGLALALSAGIEPIHRNVEIAAPAYHPNLTADTPTALTVSDTPTYLATAVLPPVMEGAALPRVHYYACTTDGGRRVILAVRGDDHDQAQALFEQCPFTVWGTIGAIPEEGWIVSAPDEKPLAGTRRQEYLNRTALTDFYDECGGNALVVYAGDTPLTMTVEEVTSPPGRIWATIFSMIFYPAHAVLCARISRKWF